MSKSNRIDSQANEQKFDSESGAVLSESVLHSKVHDGDGYNANAIFEAVANNGIKELFFEVPASYEMHPKLHIYATGDIEVSLLEATATTGTPLTPRNLSRAYPDSSNITVSHTPTAGSDGVVFIGPRRFWASGVGNNISLIDRLIEPVLSASKSYIFRVKNVDGAAINMDLHVIWYEGAHA